MEQTPFQKAKDTVYRYLEVRNRSEKEIYTKLCSKKFSPEIIDQTLNYLKDIDLINNRRFAAEWIQARLNKPLGRARIFCELKDKGIPPELFNDVWDDLKDNVKEEDRIEPLARKRLLRYKDLDPIKTKKRLFDYLLRRGFSIDAVRRVVQKL